MAFTMACPNFKKGLKMVCGPLGINLRSAHLQQVTSGASSDIVQATRLAREMVTKYGMSKAVGVVAHNYEDDGKSMSTETRLLVESEVRELLQTAYENAKRILTTHQRELHTLAATLLERETMTAAEIKALLAQVKDQTNRPNIPLPSPQPVLPIPTSTSAAQAAANAAAAVAAAAAAKTKSAAPAGT
jgi:ATP-dependent metalloprotease